MATADGEGLTVAMLEGDALRLVTTPVEIIEEWGRQDLALDGRDLQQLVDLVAALREVFSLVAAMNAGEQVAEQLDRAVQQLDPLLTAAEPLQRRRLETTPIVMREDGEITSETRAIDEHHEDVGGGAAWAALEALRPDDTDEGPALWCHPLRVLVGVLTDTPQVVGRCAWCRGLMVRETGHQRYCCESHRQLAYQARRSSRGT